MISPDDLRFMFLNYPAEFVIDLLDSCDYQLYAEKVSEIPVDVAKFCEKLLGDYNER